jgi:hypothetical protein
MATKQNLAGQRFGRLTALYTVPNNNYRTRWHCVCDCGNTKDVLQQNLTNGHVRSCGCFHYERNQEKIAAINAALGREDHHETKTRLYRIWIGIKSRCFGVSSSSYGRYGARGITVCPEWAGSFGTFKKWALSHGYSDELSIDRVDVNGDYSPDNCRWVDGSIQAFNKRKTQRNSSGHVGVSWNKKDEKWVAYITKDYVAHYLGSFDSFEKAIAARESAEIEYFGSK